MQGINVTAQAQEVLDFWFTPDPGQPADAMRTAWFKKDAAFDAKIRDRFGALIDQAIGGGLPDWDQQGPAGALARILLLDQFTRNAYRGTARAFAGDQRALATAEEAVARGFDRELTPRERWFMYMPFEHAESIPAQHRSIELFAALAQEMQDDDALAWARKHAEVVFKFGRYPHRNAILGRTSTPEEEAYLRTPGAGF
jgi:uncharacterized protein (DUF924 family)